jgi:hypothetical protein
VAKPIIERAIRTNVSFLNKIRNKNSTDFTDNLDGDILHQDEVWKNIKEIGMFEPLVIRVNLKSNEICLESGNHRIKTAKKTEWNIYPV